MERVGKIVVLPSSMTTKGPTKYGNKGHLTLNELTSSVYEGDDGIDFANLSLPLSLERRMFDHQRDGVKWMYGLYLKEIGGILGDDMGLGKTFQVTCLLTGLLTKQLLRKVLIITPVSVLPSWMRELNEHLKPHVPKASIDLVNSDLTKKKRQQILESVGARATPYKPHIIVSSYALVSSMIEDFSQFEWDYVILDEGHLIKNPTTKTTKAMHQLESKHRLMLTGTPVQNNLKEFWTIADWVTNGRRFGSLPVFTERFIIPIMNGQDPKACDFQRQISTEAIQRLMVLTKPILLQRKKCEQPPELLNLPEKVEMVIWVPLATSQRTIYDEFLRSRTFSQALECSTYPVAVINHLKTLSRHPFLLEATRVNKLRKAQLEAKYGGGGATTAAGAKKTPKTLAEVDDDDDLDVDDLVGGMSSLTLNGGSSSSGNNNKHNDMEGVEGRVLSKLPADASVFDIAARQPNIHELFQGSVKLRVLSKLVFRLHRAGHRCLVFSQSRLMLDIIQRVLVEYRLSSYRIDGSTSQRDRQQIIDDFNDLSDSYTGPTICLLTTKACGTGVTLTGADRVIIFDPSWNPAEDRQAVDRAFRIGQTRNVVVYRMIMASSVEEKMYEKQVFKDGLRVVTESGTSSRYFSSDETRALFTLGPFDRSLVMEKFWNSSGTQITSYEDTGGELPGALGYTRHDTLYREVRPQDVQDQTKDLKSRISTTSASGSAGKNSDATVNSVSKTRLESWLDQENVNKNIPKSADHNKNNSSSGEVDKKIGKQVPPVMVDLTQEDRKPTAPAAVIDLSPVPVPAAAAAAVVVVPAKVKPGRKIVIDDSEDETEMPSSLQPTSAPTAGVVRRSIPEMSDDDTGVDVTNDLIEVDMDWLKDVPSEGEEDEDAEEEVDSNDEEENIAESQGTLEAAEVDDNAEFVEEEEGERVSEESEGSFESELDGVEASLTLVTDTPATTTAALEVDKDTDYALDQRGVVDSASDGEEEGLDLCTDFAQMTVHNRSDTTPVKESSETSSEPTESPSSKSVGTHSHFDDQSVDQSVDQSCEESFLCLDLCELKDITAAAAASAVSSVSRHGVSDSVAVADTISPIKEGYCEDLSQPDYPTCSTASAAVSATVAPIEISSTDALKAFVDLTAGLTATTSDVPSPTATTEKFLPDLFYSPAAPSMHTIRAAMHGATMERAARVDNQYLAIQSKLDLLSSAIMMQKPPRGSTTGSLYGEAMTPLSYGESMFTVQSDALLHRSCVKAPQSAGTNVTGHIDRSSDTAAAAAAAAAAASGGVGYYVCNAETPQMLFSPLCNSEMAEVSPLGVTPHQAFTGFGGETCGGSGGRVGENLGADLESAV